MLSDSYKFISPIFMTSERFNNAVAYIQGLPPKGDVSPSNTQKLQFYALYKQATEGPNKSQAPSRMQMINRAKWFVFDSVGDLCE